MLKDIIIGAMTVGAANASKWVGPLKIVRGHYFPGEWEGRSIMRSMRLRNEITKSVQRPGRCVVRELTYSVGDPAPHCCAVVIVLGRELVSTRGAFPERLLTVPLEHQVGRALAVSGRGRGN
jgi:hypothetical protein